jgi:hypothetical protein
MRSIRALSLALAAMAMAHPVEGQSPAGGQPFTAGQPLDLMSNTRVFGSFHFAESCSYDPVRDVYVAPSLGNRNNVTENDGYVSLINPDGTVHTPKWMTLR